MFEKFKFYAKTHVFKRESKWPAHDTAKTTKLWSNIDPKSTYDSPTIEPNEITPLPKCIILSNSTSFKEQKNKNKKNSTPANSWSERAAGAFSLSLCVQYIGI